MEKIFVRLLELKKEQSVAAFARSIGVPQQTMDRYLKGREPPIDVIVQLCLVYKVSADWLLGLSESKSTAVDFNAQPTLNAPNNSGAIAIGGGNAVSRDCLECPLLKDHLKRFSKPR